MILKCYYNQRNSLVTDRENIAPENLCIMKANIRHRQKRYLFHQKLFTYTIRDT